MLSTLVPFEELGRHTLLSLGVLDFTQPGSEGPFCGLTEFYTYPFSYSPYGIALLYLFVPSIPAQCYAYVGICISFSLLCKKLPQT